MCSVSSGAALRAPLEAGSSVISMSSGAARMGSPLSGGYVGAKATFTFISAYAAAESERQGLGIRFVSVLPKITPVTALGSAFVDVYAGLAGIERAAYLEGLGPTLSVDDVARAITGLVADSARTAGAYTLTREGLREIG